MPLYFRYCVTAVKSPIRMAIKISMRLYENIASSPMATFFLATRLKTGNEVDPIASAEQRKAENAELWPDEQQPAR